MIKLKPLIENYDNTAKQALNVKVKELEKQLETEFPQLEDLNLYASQEDVLFIGSIRVKPEFRRQGIGGKVIDRINDFADQNQIIVSLSPEPDRGYKDKLMRFYKDHGFTPNTGRKKDYRLSSFFGMTMIRRPKIKEGARVDHLNSKIKDLEKQWDDLDNVGYKYHQQQQIAAQLDKLQKEKSSWDKMYSALS